MRKRKNIVIIILIILIIVVAFIAVMVIRRKASMEKIFGKIENINAYLTEYIVYGPHLNIKGEIRENIYNVKEVRKRRKVSVKLSGNRKRSGILHIRFN